MAVADGTTIVSSSSVMLDESGVKNPSTSSVGVNASNRDEKISRPTPTITEPPNATVDENDPTTTITSTTGSLFSNTFSGFLINRRLQGRSSQSPARMASFSKNLKHVARVSSRNLNISLARSKLYNSFPNLTRKETQSGQNGYSIDDENVRKVLKAVESDHVVLTNVADNRNRRTVFIEKFSGIDKFGFTIQSYTLRHAKTKRTEQITYVDYVDLDSPAFVAGLRAGDIILAINGRNVQNETHQQLVAYIGQCSSFRMVVLFENCVNRIELCARAIKLKKLLADKEFELRMLCCQEQRILSGMPPFTDVEILDLLRTPCNTPRSVSFALPNNNNDHHSGSTNCARRPSAPPRSTNVYVNEDDAADDDDSKRDIGEKDDADSVIHYMDVEDVNEFDGPQPAPLAGNDDDAVEEDEQDDRSIVNDGFLDPLSSWEIKKKKACFIVGSEAGSNDQSSSRQSSFRRSIASAASVDDGNDEPPMCPSISGHAPAADDLALIHILHIDDAPEDPANASPERVVVTESPCVAITRF